MPRQHSKILGTVLICYVTMPDHSDPIQSTQEPPHNTTSQSGDLKTSTNACTTVVADVRQPSPTGTATEQIGNAAQTDASVYRSTGSEWPIRRLWSVQPDKPNNVWYHGAILVFHRPSLQMAPRLLLHRLTKLLASFRDKFKISSK